MITAEVGWFIVVRESWHTWLQRLVCLVITNEPERARFRSFWLNEHVSWSTGEIRSHCRYWSPLKRQSGTKYIGVFEFGN